MYALYMITVETVLAKNINEFISTLKNIGTIEK